MHRDFALHSGELSKFVSPTSSSVNFSSLSLERRRQVLQVKRQNSSSVVFCLDLITLLAEGLVSAFQKCNNDFLIAGYSCYFITPLYMISLFTN